MGDSDITVEILKDIRGELRTSNHRLASVEEQLGGVQDQLGSVQTQLGVVSTALLDLAELETK